MLSDQYYEYQQLLLKYQKKPSNEKIPELEVLLENTLEFFCYSNLKEIIKNPDYTGEIQLKNGAMIKVTAINGIINIVATFSNGEVFNGVWSNLAYNKIVENAPKLFEKYDGKGK